MYSKEEAKKIRKIFWDQFKSWSGGLRIKKGKQGRWLMNETGMRQIRLKFHFDEKMALAGIEVDSRNLDKRLEIWGKLEALKARLEEMADFEIAWDIECELETEKTVSRIYSYIPAVNIYDKDDWRKVNEFLYKKMTVFEAFFLEYRDYLKY